MRQVGCGSLPPRTQVFAAKFSDPGQCIWSTAITTAPEDATLGSAYPFYVAADTQGMLTVTGRHSGPTVIGNRLFEGVLNVPRGFVVRLTDRAELVSALPTDGHGNAHVIPATDERGALFLFDSARRSIAWAPVKLHWTRSKLPGWLRSIRTGTLRVVKRSTGERWYF